MDLRCPLLVIAEVSIPLSADAGVGFSFSLCCFYLFQVNHPTNEIEGLRHPITGRSSNPIEVNSAS